MAFQIRCTVAAVAVERILWLFKDRRARFLSSFKMLVDIVHIDVEVLRDVAESLRILILSDPDIPS